MDKADLVIYPDPYIAGFSEPGYTWTLYPLPVKGAVEEINCTVNYRSERSAVRGAKRWAKRHNYQIGRTIRG